jgi:hypothetical protein
VHQLDLHHCNEFCENKENPDWQCYHHQILFTGIMEDLEPEVENLNALLQADLVEGGLRSKIKIHANTPIEILMSKENLIYF